MQLTTQTAIYILRRRPQCEGERLACEAALKTLGKAGVPLREVEVDIMRTLDEEEKAIYRSAV